MTPAQIIVDLDGTLLDVAPRYRRLHRDVVVRHGGRPLDGDDDWQAKRDGALEANLLALAGLTGAAASAADAARRSSLESRRYLRLDAPWPWTEAALDALGRLAPLVLVSLRRHADRLAWQLDRLGLRRRFAHVVCGPSTGDLEIKARLLRDAGLACPGGAVFIGDTEVDIASGRALGALTVAVGCGLRSPERLRSSQPNLLFDHLGHAAHELAALAGAEYLPAAAETE